MDLTTLRAVLWDLRGRVLPSRFEKAQQPSPGTIQLGFRSLKGMVWLELSWQADSPRLTAIEAPPREGAGSTLAQQLQHSLRQLALVKLHQEGFERVVEFHFAPRPGEPIQRVLVLELMGRHSNLLLLDEQRRVIAPGRQVRDHQSRIRPISTGDDYCPPPPLQGHRPDKTERFERWQERLSLIPIPLKKALQQTYQGISPALATQLAGSWLTTPVDQLKAEQWETLHRRWCRWLEQMDLETFALQTNPNGSYRVWGENPAATQDSLALGLGKFYQERLGQRVLAKAQEELRHKIERWRSKEESELNDQQQRLKATENHAEIQQQADALLSLRQPNRDQINEAQKLYKRARKLRRSVAILNERIDHHQQRLALIHGSEGFIEEQLDAMWQDDLARKIGLQELQRELDDLLSPGEPPQSRRRQKQNQPQPLELTSPSGILVQVGRNHRQNDWISLRQARSGDLWFHAQECPGSHVVLKSSNAPADEDDLQLATDLAAYFSRARGNSIASVVMVPTDQLQRIAGAGPGTVRHGSGEIRWGHPQRIKERLFPPSLVEKTG
ncbi:secreted protein MPB70 precursor-like [Synechococcus sp. BL107]|uniref:Rqc2 family fibronectin-binding protein n=1 Tax=Synechococcus sp. BL107 TaxID=313625 RepID=UPI0000E53EA3|nr:NFACT RNA binding domain-containing protein [Synechococcus sp. BL107]EAU70109.1 secreted protein MPB70 precursor-like [Synechococcus sp. BL107]